MLPLRHAVARFCLTLIFDVMNTKKYLQVLRRYKRLSIRVEVSPPWYCRIAAGYRFWREMFSPCAEPINN